MYPFVFEKSRSQNMRNECKILRFKSNFGSFFPFSQCILIEWHNICILCLFISLLKGVNAWSTSIWQQCQLRHDSWITNAEVSLLSHSTSISPFIPFHTGFTGHDCSTPATGCTSNPCDTKGTSMCEEQQGGFKCMCHRGYTGLFCETSISHCVEGLCHHGSKCVDLPLGFVCECLPGKNDFVRPVSCQSPCLHLHESIHLTLTPFSSLLRVTRTILWGKHRWLSG